MKRLFRDSWSRVASASAALIAVIALLAPCAAQATPYVVKLRQQGNDVLAVANGVFDLTGLTANAAADGTGVGGVLISSAAYVDTGVGGGFDDAYSGLTGPTDFGSGDTTFADSTAGDFVVLCGSSQVCVGNEALLFVPQGYVSGTFLSGSSTWNNASFASLGITSGRYTWTWGSAADQSFTLDAFTAVPEPAPLGTFGFGLLLLGGFLTLRGRQAGSAC